MFLKDVSSRRAQPHRDSTSSVYDTSDQPSSIGAIHKRINPISPSVREIAECLLFLLAYQVAIGHIPASYGRSISSDPDLSRLCESLTNDRPVLTGIFLVGIYNLLSEVNKEPYEDLKHHPHLFVAYKEGHNGDIRKTTLVGWSKSVIQSVTAFAYEQHHILLEVMRSAQ